MWKYTGASRPEFAETPGPDQESVWDYPRPPRLERTAEKVEVRVADRLIASSQDAHRVLETASPPTYYIPSDAVNWDFLESLPNTSFCEWKGVASYFGLKDSPQLGVVAWRYENPNARFAAIDNHVSFYPRLVECYVNDERVLPQPGGFYGGWITSRVVGPFKGEPGTGHW